VTLEDPGARNHFRLDESAAKLIFVAGGTGVGNDPYGLARALRLRSDDDGRLHLRRRGLVEHLDLVHLSVVQARCELSAAAAMTASRRGTGTALRDEHCLQRHEHGLASAAASRRRLAALRSFVALAERLDAVQVPRFTFPLQQFPVPDLRLVTTPVSNLRIGI
jgi:hypothetical protein